MTTNREKHSQAWEIRRRIAGHGARRGALLIVAVVAAVVAALVVGVVG